MEMGDAKNTFSMWDRTCPEEHLTTLSRKSVSSLRQRAGSKSLGILLRSSGWMFAFRHPFCYMFLCVSHSLQLFLALLFKIILSCDLMTCFVYSLRPRTFMSMQDGIFIARLLPRRSVGRKNKIFCTVTGATCPRNWSVAQYNREADWRLGWVPHLRLVLMHLQFERRNIDLESMDQAWQETFDLTKCRWVCLRGDTVVGVRCHSVWNKWAVVLRPILRASGLCLGD